ncbi:hypothetical protein [Fortiea sp. LEGE XX443]|nr:hypothetical protein [Fortiea sp. LEGE XX443]
MAITLKCDRSPTSYSAIAIFRIDWLKNRAIAKPNKVLKILNLVT